MYKCKNCEFTCMSEKLMKQHNDREELCLSEYEQKGSIRAAQKKARLSYLNFKEEDISDN